MGIYVVSENRSEMLANLHQYDTPYTSFNTSLILSPISSILIRYGVSNWMGITDEKEMNYVLPNNGNMGCDLYTDRDMYTVGNTTINGCNDRTVGIKLSMFLNEPR